MTRRDEVARDGSSERGQPPDLRAIFLGVAGAVLVVLLIVRWTRPEASEASSAVPEVSVCHLASQDVRTTVEVLGVVGPSTEVDVVPEVSGKVVFVHSGLTPGGIIRANEKIVQIDSRQHELDVRRARAAVTEAQIKLDTELARARLTEGQRSLSYQESEADLPSALAELQVRQARAALEWAEAELAMAELKLERTSISLPFDVMVLSENVDLGGHVAVGRQLATVCGIDAFQIDLSVDQNDLAGLDVPGQFASSSDGMAQGPTVSADVEAEFGGRRYTWPGSVSRVGGQIDPVSQLVPVVVEVAKPLEASEDRPPLLPGASVEVVLPGPTLSSAIAVPRSVIHDDNTVWLVRDDCLGIVTLDIAWSDAEFVYVTSGLTSEDVIVTSPLESPVDGMAVHIKADSPGSSD